VCLEFQFHQRHDQCRVHDPGRQCGQLGPRHEHVRHHQRPLDGGWFERDTFNTYSNALNSNLINIWTQVGNQFKSYDSNKLAFACANEPDAGNQVQVNNLYHYYQNWINAMRANGGNNATRWLVVQAGDVWDWSVLLNYGTNMPTDSANKLMIEEHTYDPASSPLTVPIHRFQ